VKCWSLVQHYAVQCKIEVLLMEIDRHQSHTNLISVPYNHTAKILLQAKCKQINSTGQRASTIKN
jgi:hypothetical protein